LAVFHSALKRQHLLATPHRSGLQCPWGHLLCPLLTPTVCSGTITGLSVPCRPWPAGTHRRSPGVSSCTFGAQPLDLRLWSLMEMDFVLSCALVRPQRLLSSFCSSARTWATRFFQTSPHGDALAFRSPSPPSGWQRDLHPPSAGTCPAHIMYHPPSGWFEDAPLKGGAVLAGPLRGPCCLAALSEGPVVGSPLQRALWWEALSEGAVAGGPLRGLRDCLDPPHGDACLTSEGQNPPTPVARRASRAPPDSGCTAG